MFFTARRLTFDIQGALLYDTTKSDAEIDSGSRSSLEIFTKFAFCILDDIVGTTIFRRYARGAGGRDEPERSDNTALERKLGLECYL